MDAGKIEIIQDALRKCTDLTKLQKIKRTTQLRLIRVQKILNLVESRIKQIGGNVP